MPIAPTGFTVILRLCNLPQFASYPASNLDGRKNANRRGLHGRRFAVNLRRPLSVERNHVVVTVPIGTLRAGTIVVDPRCRQGSAREITAGRRPSADLIPSRVCARDVRSGRTSLGNSELRRAEIIRLTQKEPSTLMFATNSAQKVLKIQACTTVSMLPG